MMKEHHFAIDNKAGCSNPDSASVISANQPEKSQHRRLCALAIGVALLSILILALPRIPAAASTPQHKFPAGATAPWEKTAGPHGVTTNVIFEANNIVYAGTQTQG